MTVLADSEHRFRTIFDCSPDCIKLISADGRLLDMNAAGLRMIEAESLSAVRHRSLFDFIDAAYHHSVRDGFDAVLTGKTTQMQFEVVGLGGRRLFMDQSAAPLLASDGRVVEIVAVSRDATEERRAEAELLEARLSQEIMRSAAAFAANLGQELKSPLNNIIGYTELLLESAQEQRRQCDADDLKRVLSAAADLQSMLDQMLTAALAETKRRMPPTDKCDIDDLVDAAVETIRPLAAANGARINIEIDPQCASFDCGDRKLAQCVQVLLSNAAASTHHGSITVKARRVVSNGQSWLVLSVIDTGIGMTPEHLSALFETRSDPNVIALGAAVRPVSGLAAARQLARLMGGDITATSAPGQGSRLTLKAPIQSAQEANLARLRIRER